MTDHYYSQQPHSQLETEEIRFTLRNHSFTFITGSGVFSKKTVDFGTRQLIETFEEPSVAGPFLDLGCGYGPIGLALAKSFPERVVWMTDVNERAIMLAQENGLRNKVENVKIVMSDGFERIEEEQFAAILTNPPIRAGKKIVYRMLEDSFKHLRGGGELWVVVQKKQGAPSMFAFLKEIFSQAEIKHRKKGYHVIRAVKND